MVDVVNHSDTSWTTANDTSDEPDGALDYPHANNDNDVDFQEEEE